MYSKKAYSRIISGKVLKIKQLFINGRTLYGCVD